MQKAKTLSLFTLSAKIPDEAAAVAFFEANRWGDQPICPHCESTRSSPRPARKGHHCNACGKDYTVRIGTVMECSRMPVRKWLFAMYLIQTARKGVSALELSKKLDTTYRAAWFMGHRIRAACQADLGELLSGIVEIDETFVGGLEENRHEHKKVGSVQHGGKAAVLGLRERGAGGRTIALPIPDTGKKTLHAAIHAHVAAGSILYTDELNSYKSLDGEVFQHQAVCHSAKEWVEGMAHTNGIESVWAVLKRGFKGTFHNWSMKHLHLYVNEFTFRLNEGNVRRDTEDRLASLVKAFSGKRLTYAALTAN